MATSIIDQFIVTLGLDSSKYHKGQKQAIDDLNKLKKEAGKTSKELSSKGKEAGLYFSELRSEATKLFAVLAGGVGFASLIDNLTDSNNQLGLLSKNIGVSARELVAWSNVSEKMGGSAAGMKAAFAAMKKAQQDYIQFGTISGDPNALARLGINPLDDPLTRLQKAAEYVGTHSRENAYSMIKQGLTSDEGLINVLLLGTKALNERKSAEMKLAEKTSKNTEASARFKNELETIRKETVGFAQDLYEKAIPVIEKFGREVVKAYNDITDNGKLLTENKEVIKDFFIVISAIITGVFVKAMWSALAPMAAMAGGIAVLAFAIAGLYQDYQTWKNEGAAHSLIDYSKWEPGINDAITGLTFLRNILRDTIYYLDKLTGGFFTRITEDFWLGYNGIMDKINYYNNQEGTEPENNGGRLNRLMDIIGEGEAGGDYSAYNRGTEKGKIVGAGTWDQIPLMTIGQIKENMTHLGRDGKKVMNTAGKYQFIKETLERAQKKAGLTDEDIFSPENQDKLFLANLPQIAQDYIDKKQGVDLGQALEAIGKEWAIVGVPSKGGASNYGSGNKSNAGITSRVAEELIALRGDTQFYTDLKAGANEFLKQGPNAINTPSNSIGNTNNTHSSEVHVGEVIINTQAKDAKGIANDMGKAIKNMDTFYSDYGMN
jgi:hypothetical protein